jgi:glycosyltransferase involved in cell wall biosynthesis
MPLVSVIIPTYNRNALIKEAVESVLAQTLGDLEVLVVDDGSTDNTRKVIDAITDKRVKSFFKENGGVSSAKNIGLKNATGEYIAFLDSDDLWNPDYLDTMISALKKNQQYGVAYTTLDQYYTDGRVAKKYRAKYCISGRVTCKFFYVNFIWIPGVIVRKKLMDGFSFDETLRSCGDIDFILRFSLATEFLYVEGNLVKRRVQINSISKVNDQSLVSINKAIVLERFYNQHNNVFPDKTKACKKISGTYREIGNRFYNKKDFQNARYAAQKAIHYNKINIKNYILAAKSFWHAK